MSHHDMRATDDQRMERLREFQRIANLRPAAAADNGERLPLGPRPGFAGAEAEAETERRDAERRRRVQAEREEREAEVEFHNRGLENFQPGMTEDEHMSLIGRNVARIEQRRDRAAEIIIRQVHGRLPRNTGPQDLLTAIRMYETVGMQDQNNANWCGDRLREIEPRRMGWYRAAIREATRRGIIDQLPEFPRDDYIQAIARRDAYQEALVPLSANRRRGYLGFRGYMDLMYPLIDWLLERRGAINLTFDYLQTYRNERGTGLLPRPGLSTSLRTLHRLLRTVIERLEENEDLVHPEGPEDDEE